MPAARLSPPRSLLRRAAMSAAAAGVVGGAASSMEPATKLPALDSLKLLQVQAAFRHGARTPMDDMGDVPAKWLASEQRSYTRASERLGKCPVPLTILHAGSSEPLDAAEVFCGWRSKSPHTLNGGGGAGILTNVGLDQANALGAALRARYVDPRARTSVHVSRRFLLPSNWGAAQRLVAARSTLVERTVFTAGGVLAGLFPDDAAAGAMAAEVSLNVPRGSSGAEEYMVINVERCPRLRALFKQGQKLSVQGLDARQRYVLERVEAKDNADAWYLPLPEWKLIAYRDEVACRRADGKKVPPHIGAIEPELARAASQQMHAIFEGGACFLPPDEQEATRREALRLGIGRMVAHILHTLERPDGKLHLYSGHDWTVGPLLMCFCRPEDPLAKAWPRFCADLSIELWASAAQPSGSTAAPASSLGHWPAYGAAPRKAEESRYVRVLYNGEPLDMPCSPRGEGLCRLSAFKQMLAKYCVQCFETECGGGGGEASEQAKRY